MDINDYNFYGYGYTEGESPAQGNPYANINKNKPAEKKSKKRGGAAKTVAIALCCSMLGGAFGAAATSAVKSMNTNTTVLTQSARTAAVDVSYVNSDKEMTAAEVYAKNVNSTVGITTSITTNYFGFKTASAAAGSGFIISEDGYVITNYHVVEDSDSIKVTTYAGESFDAELVGYDESNDVAVLKINASGLTPVVLGNSDSVNVGDDVVAIGNPLGELTFSLTKGSVSALDREVTFASGVTMNLIQTDAAINSGNSGGALFNMYGEVIGITNAKYSSDSTGEASVDNIGFAIPLDSVKSIITSIIEKGYIEKPFIGVSLSDTEKGVAVYSVTENSPAENAGVEKNDVIVAVNGEAVKEASDVTAVVKAASVGDEIKLTLLRSGQTVEVTVTVGEKQQSALPETETENAQDYYSNDNSFPYGFPFGFSGEPDRG